MTTQEKDLPASVVNGGAAEVTPMINDGVKVQSGRGARVPLKSQLLQECNAMAKYALANALDIDPVTVESLQRIIEAQATDALLISDSRSSHHRPINQLAQIHKTLSKLVYPATPRSIALLEFEEVKNSFWYFLGPVPLIRWLSAAALFFLGLLLMVSLNTEVNVTNINLGLLSSDHNILVLNQLFILCCAGLGASFAALFKANSFIANATYDPRFDSSYWSRIILGVISGIIIVELLPSSLFSEGTMKSFGKPSLAMFGGFSADVVYRILQRLVESLETMVKGKDSSGQSQQILLEAKTSEQVTQLNATTANKLVGLVRDMEGASSQEVQQQLHATIEGLLEGYERQN